MAVEDIDVQQKTLDAAPGRAAEFLLAVGAVEGIQSALSAFGYSVKEQDHGWSLVHAVDTYGLVGRSPSVPADPEKKRRFGLAVAELDGGDEKWFGIAAAVLEIDHTPQYDFLFEELKAAQGPSSVLGWQTFVDRIDVLEKGALIEAGKHKDTRSTQQRKADHAALEALAQCGINEAFLTRIRSLLTDATTLNELTLPSDGEKKSAEELAAQRQSALKSVYAWHRKWAKIAAKVITRRDWLIKLGIAERKVGTEEAPPEGET